jgi:hypothetical protein
MVLCLIASIACDDNDTLSPSSPTRSRFTGSLSGPPVIGSLSGSTVISGRVTGLDPNLTGQTGSLTAPRVGIAPPGISTVVGRDGDFTFSGVPPGNVSLIFSSNGVSAGVIVGNVGFNQLIVLDVNVNNGVATIESDHRSSREQPR